MKIKLDQDGIANEFLEHSFIIGIVAPIKDYTFAWNINQKLGFKFRNNHLEIQLIKKGRSYFFPVFEFKNMHFGSEYFLYNNHHDGEYLLPEFKHLDFLWMIKCLDEPPGKAECDALLKNIRLIPAVQLANELPVNKIKNKLHLIF